MQAQDAAPSVATLEWPPAADDLDAIACVDLIATRGVVCPSTGPAPLAPVPHPLRPLQSGSVDDDGALRWPPPQADLDRITAWSVADGTLRARSAPRVRVGRNSRIGAAAAAVGAAATLVFAIAPSPTRDTDVAPAQVASGPAMPPVSAMPDTGRAAAAPVRPSAERARTAAAAVVVSAAPVRRPMPPSPTLRTVTAVTTARPITGSATSGARREAGDLIDGQSLDARPSEVPPSALEPSMAVSTELSGGLPVEPIPPAFAADGAEPAASVPPGLARMGAAPPRDLDEPRIQAVLSRYGAAYSRLDAGAAREVWPTVDERALSRAFDGLRSQEVVLDQCDIAVSGDRAEAACRGTSTFVPRVGDPTPRRESRRWRFELARTEASAWHIRSAESR